MFWIFLVNLIIFLNFWINFLDLRFFFGVGRGGGIIGEFNKLRKCVILYVRNFEFFIVNIKYYEVVYELCDKVYIVFLYCCLNCKLWYIFCFWRSRCYRFCLCDFCKFGVDVLGYGMLIFLILIFNYCCVEKSEILNIEKIIFFINFYFV